MPQSALRGVVLFHASSGDVPEDKLLFTETLQPEGFSGQLEVIAVSPLGMQDAGVAGPYPR